MDNDHWLCSVCGGERFTLTRVKDTDIWLCWGCWALADSEWWELVMLVREAEDDQ